MRKRTHSWVHYLVIIVTLIASLMPSLVLAELTPIDTNDTAEAGSISSSTGETTSTHIEMDSGGGGNPAAPGRPVRSPQRDCMVFIDSVVFLDQGPGSYPTSYFDVGNGEITDPLWVDRDISDIPVPDANTPRVMFGQRLVLYIALRNDSDIAVNCSPGGHDVIISQIHSGESGSSTEALWPFVTGGTADFPLELQWSSGIPGVLNVQDTAWGLWIFEIDESVGPTIDFLTDFTMASCTPGPSSGPACDNYLHPAVLSPRGVSSFPQGGPIAVVGPRIAYDFSADPILANPDQVVTYVLDISALTGGSVQTSTIVSLAGDPLTLFDCQNGTFGNGGGGWFPDAAGFGAEVDNMALAPPITAINNQHYYCIFTLEMDEGIVDPITSTFTLEGDIVVTDVNGLSATYHVVADEVYVFVPDLTVTKVVVSPDPVLGVSVGGTVTYSITIRNTGEVPLRQISGIDSLTGPLPIGAGTVLAADPDGPAGPGIGGEITLTTSYQVRINDPSTLVNTVTVTAQLDLIGVNQTIQDTAAASIRVIAEDLQATLILELVDGTPYDPVLNPAQAGSVLTFRTQYDNRGTVNLRDLQYVAGYPTYINPPVPSPHYVNSLIGTGPILPGIYGDDPGETASRFVYNVPATNPPDPIFERVRLRAFRPNNTAVFADALLVVDLTNDSISITAQRYRPGDIVPVAPDEAVLRGDTLYFSGTIVNESANPLCGVVIRQYLRNPVTGVLTPATPFEIPNTNIIWLSGTAGSLAPSNGVPDGPDEATFNGVTYVVNASTPDPLDVVFEVVAPASGGGCTPLAQPLVDATTVTTDISDIQLATFIQAFRTLDGAQVQYALYPPPEFTYEFRYRATNVGGTQFTIRELQYCVPGFAPPRACQNFPVDSDIFFTPGLDDIFVPFETRGDHFDLPFLAANAQNYVNPLQIQVILRGEDYTGSTVVVRTLFNFPIISNELPGTLTGPLNTNVEPDDVAPNTSLVRRDANVPFNFSFTNETNTVLENVHVVNLLESVGSAQPGYQQIVAFGFNGFYEICTVTSITSNPTPPATGPYTLQPDDTITGTCYLTYHDGLPGGGFAMQVLAIGNRVVSPGQSLISVVTWNVREVPHIRVTKIAPGSVVATEDIDYEVTIYNQSMYQYVDFNTSAGAFTDVMVPDPAGSSISPPGFGLANFTNLTAVPPSLLRLAPSGVSVGSYDRLAPPAPGFVDPSYQNTVTLTGQGQGGLISTATATATVGISCPLMLLGEYDEIPGDPFAHTDGNLRFTLGERVRFTFYIVNISDVPITLTALSDEFFGRENQLPDTDAFFVVDYPTATAGLIPAGQAATYEYDFILRPEDFPQPIDMQVVTFAASVTIGGATGTDCETFDVIWFFSAPNPVGIIKTVNPGLVFPGGTATYDIALDNRSERSRIQVNNLTDSLLSPTGLRMDFTSASPNGPTGELGALGGPAPDDNTATLELNGDELYQVPQDAEPSIENEAIVFYYPLSGPTGPAPGTVNPGPFLPFPVGPVTGNTMSNRAEALLATAFPLACTILPSQPPSGQPNFPAGGVVDILITLSNSSTEGTVTGVTFQLEALDGTGNILLDETSPGVPAPLDLAAPDQQSFVVQYTIPAGWSLPTLTFTCTASGVFNLPAMPPLPIVPPVQSSALINVAAPELVVTKTVFGDAACTNPLPDDFPDPPPTDLIPEAAVNTTIFYRIEFANTSLGLNFYITAVEDTLNNGTTLTAAVEAALLVELPAGTPIAPGTSEVICVPYFIPDQQTDPLINTIEVTAQAVIVGNVPPGTEFIIQESAPVDVIDSNLSIFKTAAPTVSFPGEQIVYTLTIRNLNSTLGLLLDDVWDSHLGGQVTGAGYQATCWDIDVTPYPADFSACNPNATSIPFNDTITPGVDNYGWTWFDPLAPGVIPPSGQAVYTYTYTVQPTDPDPLIDTAGVRAFQYDFGTPTADPSNPSVWTLQRDLAGDPIEPTDGTMALVAITNSQLLVRKDAVPSVAQAGTEVDYRVTVVNIGNRPVLNVNIIDDVYNADIGAAPGTPLPLALCSTTQPSITLDPYVGTVICDYSIVMPTAAELAANPALDPYVNTVIAEGEISTGGAPIPLYPPGSDTAIVDILVPGMQVEKAPSVGSASIGDVVAYTLLVHNIGDGELLLETLVDVPNTGGGSFPVTQVFIGPEADGVNVCTTGVATPLPATILQTQLACAVVNVTVTDPSPATEFVNTVRATGRVDPTGANIPVVDSTSAEIDIRNLGLIVEKDAYDCDPTTCLNPQIINSIDEGVQYFYGVTITNATTESLDSIEITDPLYNGGVTEIVTDGFTDTPTTPPPPDVDDSTELDPGESFTFVYAFTASYATHGPALDNTVTIVGVQVDTDRTDPRRDSARVVIVPATLDITKRACIDVNGTPPTSFNPCTPTAPTVAQPGDTIWYEVVVTNPSNVLITGIAVTDTLVGGALDPADMVVPWPTVPGSLGPNESVTWVYEGDPVPLAVTNVTNTATVVGDANGEPISENATAIVPVASGDLAVQVVNASCGGVVSDGTLNFTIIVTNLSTTDAITGITVSVPFIGANPLNPIPFDLAAGASNNTLTFSYAVTAVDTTMVFTAIAEGTLQAVQVIAQNSCTITRMPPGLTVTKTANVTYVSIGGTIDYTITIENTTDDAGGPAPQDIINILVDDPLLNALWPAAWPTTLAPGATATQTATYPVTAPIPGNPILNTVTVTGLLQVANTPITAQAGPVAVYVPAGDLLVTNTPSTLDTVVGDLVTFTYEICNLSTTTPIDNVSLVDNLGPLVTFGFLDFGECLQRVRTNVEMMVTDIPVYTMTVTGSGTQNIGGVDVPLSQTISRDVNVRDPNAELVFTATAAPNPAVDGNVVVFNFTLRNVSTGNLTIASVQDNGDTGFTAYTPNPVGQVLAPGEVFAFTGTPTYTADSAVADPINGAWTATATTPAAVTVTANAALVVPVVTNPAAVVVIDQVTANPVAAAPGGTVTYTYTVRNISGAIATGVYLDIATAPAPANCTWAPVNPLGNPLWDTAAGATIPVAGQATADATCVVPAVPTGTTVTHTIELHVLGATPTLQDDAAVSTPIPALEVDAPTSNPTVWRVGAGFPVDISYVFRNSSPSIDITSITTEMLIDGVAICNNTPADAIPDLTFTPAMTGVLAANAEVTATCADYVVQATSIPTETVTVVVNGMIGAVPVTAQAQTTFNVVDAAFDMTLTANPTAGVVGNTIVFTLTLENTGGSDLYLPPASANPVTSGRLDNPTATNVLGDIYPLIAASSCFSGTGGAFQPGASCTITGVAPALTYTLVATDPATITFMVQMTLWNAPTNPTYEVPQTATEVVTVGTGAAAINAYNLTVTPNPATVGGQVTFTVNIQNSGIDPLNTLQVTVQLTQLSTVNAVEESTGIVLTGGRNQGALPTLFLMINDANGVLNPGEVATATGFWTVDRTGTFNALVTATGRTTTSQATATDIENIQFRTTASTFGTATATVPATDPEGNPLDPNALDPAIVKTVTPESALPGQDVTFTVTITNGSTTPMANVTITDNMPTGLTVGTATTSIGASVVSGQLITITTGQLNPGQRVTVVITARVNDDVSVPSLLTNEACGAVTGRTQVCAQVELAIGAGADALPTTGLGEPNESAATLDIATQGVSGVAERPFGLAPLLMLGLLMLLSTGQISRQRWVLGGIAVLIIAVIAGALILVGGGDDDTDDGVTPEVVLPPGVTPTAGATLDRAPTLTALATGGPLESPVAPTPIDAPPTLRPSPTPYVAPTPSGDRVIEIPKLDFTAPIPIVELPYVDEEWDVSQLGHNVGWLEKTTWMAPTWGNTVLVAHVQLAADDPGPFKNLEDLEVGDEIFVYEGTRRFSFRVVEKTTVNATAVTVTHPTVDPMLTLLTCTNWDFARGVYADRLVIRAEPFVNTSAAQ